MSTRRETENTDLVEALMAETNPRTMLCIGRSACERLGEWAAEDPRRVLRTMEGREPLVCLGDQRFDLAFVAALQAMDKTTGSRLVARLRDVNSARLVVRLAPGEHDWRETDMLALGLVRLAPQGHDAAAPIYYGFDIASYKVTPDWLNPKFWANPENWDKYWW